MNWIAASASRAFHYISFHIVKNQELNSFPGNKCCDSEIGTPAQLDRHFSFEMHQQAIQSFGFLLQPNRVKATLRQ